MSHLALGGTGVDSREFVALQCERVEEERAQCPDASGSTIPSLGEAEDHHEQDQLDGHQPGGTDRATGGVRDPRSGEELWRRCMEGRRRIDLLVEDYQVRRGGKGGNIASIEFNVKCACILPCQESGREHSRGRTAGN